MAEKSSLIENGRLKQSCAVCRGKGGFPDGKVSNKKVLQCVSYDVYKKGEKEKSSKFLKPDCEVT